MWTLVNASYGIAMGQRPAGVAQPCQHRGCPPQMGSALLSSDPQLEATQWRRREQVVHAAHEQWVEQLSPRTLSRPAIKVVPLWVQAFWLRLLRVVSGEWSQMFGGLMRQTRRETTLLD